MIKKRWVLQSATFLLLFTEISNSEKKFIIEKKKKTLKTLIILSRAGFFVSLPGLTNSKKGLVMSRCPFYKKFFVKMVLDMTNDEIFHFYKKT